MGARADLCGDVRKVSVLIELVITIIIVSLSILQHHSRLKEWCRLVYILLFGLA